MKRPQTLQTILTRELSRAGITDEEAGSHAWNGRQTIWYEPGFGVRCYASGREIYVAQVRIADRLRTITLCNRQFVTKRRARTIARRVILAAQVGQDPAEDKQRTRATPPFDKFLENYWKLAEPTWKPSTQLSNRKYRHNHFDGAFAGLGIDEIDEAAVTEWHAFIVRNSGPGKARRALAMLTTIFNKAHDWGLRRESHNPCKGVRRIKGRKMERFLTEAELARLGAALERRRTDWPRHTAALLLLALTGCRLSEILDLAWAEVRGGKLALKNAKAGPRTVWLGPEAQAVLASLPRGKPATCLFIDPVTGRKISLSEFWTEIRKETALPGVRLHDLRHTFASRGAALSEPLPMIGALLGHATVQSTARYAHLDDADLVATARIIGDLIGRMAGFEAGG